MTLYLDTSCVVPLHIAEVTSDAVSAVVAAGDALPIVSDYGMGEFGSVISRYVRMKLLSVQAANTLLAAADEWAATGADVMRIDSADVYRAASLVRRFELKLLLPDAIHIALCANRGLALATLDMAMADAAKAVGLKVVVPT